MGEILWEQRKWTDIFSLTPLPHANTQTSIYSFGYREMETVRTKIKEKLEDIDFGKVL